MKSGNEHFICSTTSKKDSKKYSRVNTYTERERERECTLYIKNIIIIIIMHIRTHYLLYYRTRIFGTIYIYVRARAQWKYIHTHTHSLIHAHFTNNSILSWIVYTILMMFMITLLVFFLFCFVRVVQFKIQCAFMCLIYMLYMYVGKREVYNPILLYTFLSTLFLCLFFLLSLSHSLSVSMIRTHARSRAYTHSLVF